MISVLSGLLGSVFGNSSENNSQNNGIVTNNRQATAGLILGVAIAATVVSAVSIVGLPLLGITIPIIAIAGTVLVQEGRATKELNNQSNENNIAVVADQNVDKLVSAMSAFGSGSSDTFSLNRRDTDTGETSLLLLSSCENAF